MPQMLCQGPGMSFISFQDQLIVSGEMFAGRVKVSSVQGALRQLWHNSELLIGQSRSRDQNTGLWLAAGQTHWLIANCRRLLSNIHILILYLLVSKGIFSIFHLLESK